MANNRVLVVGGGLAGLSATMKLAELGVAVDLLSLTPVKRSHSVCAQGGINSVNDQTRQQGDTEWNHFDDTTVELRDSAVSSVDTHLNCRFIGFPCVSGGKSQEPVLIHRQALRPSPIRSLSRRRKKLMFR